MLFATGGFRLGLVLIAAIGVGLSVVAGINLATMGDDGFDPTLGVSLAIVLPFVSLIGAIGLWPFGSDVVPMDRLGPVTTGRDERTPGRLEQPPRVGRTAAPRPSLAESPVSCTSSPPT